jgi:hypothetical protein
MALAELTPPVTANSANSANSARGARRGRRGGARDGSNNTARARASPDAATTSRDLSAPVVSAPVDVFVGTNVYRPKKALAVDAPERVAQPPAQQQQQRARGGGARGARRGGRGRGGGGGAHVAVPAQSTQQ